MPTKYRPKATENSLWVQMKLHDGTELEALIPNELMLCADGIYDAHVLSFPDIRSQRKHRVILKKEILSVEVLGAVNLDEYRP